MSVYQVIFVILFSNICSTPLTFNFTLNEKKLISYAEEFPHMEIDYSSQTPTTSICFGAHKKCFNVLLSLSLHYTWVVDIANPDRGVTNKFDEIQSNTCKSIDKLEILLDNGNRIKGKAFEDSMWIGGQKIEKIKFISVSNSEEFPGIEGMLGLGYSPNKEEGYYAIRDQLFNARLIKHMAFEVDFLDNKRGSLALGYISSGIAADYMHYGNCPIAIPSLKKKKSYWECVLLSISLGKQYSEKEIIRFNEGVVRFDLSTDKTLFPISYLLQLEKVYFQKSIENGDCNFGIKNNYYTYTCLDNNLPEFKEFSLVFNEWAIHIPFVHLFVYDPVDKEYEFVIYNKDGYDGFVIGTNIMRHYKMIFDEANHMVGFYNNNPQFLIRVSDEPIRPPKNEGDGERPPQPPKDKPLQPEPGDKENPYKPPFNKEDNDDNNDRPIAVRSGRGFFTRFFMSLGVITLIFSILFVLWLAFRYYRRKKFNDPSFYYKSTDNLFDEGTRIE